MAKPLIFTLGGVTYETQPTKVERKKVYGFTEMKATTPDGELCRQVSLDGNGMTVIPKGAVKMAMTNAAGEWVEKSDLTPRHADGRAVVPVASSFDAPIVLNKEATEEDLLDLIISSVYQLGESAELAAQVGNKIFTFPFSYRGGNKADVAFLIANGENIFVFVGEKAEFEMIGLAEQAVLDDPDEEVEEETDELDFSMF